MSKWTPRRRKQLDFYGESQHLNHFFRVFDGVVLTPKTSTRSSVRHSRHSNIEPPLRDIKDDLQQPSLFNEEAI